MSASEFLAAISSRALRHVAEHWVAARGFDRMPSWSAINPKAIVAELPILWAYRYDSVTNSFIGRLSGQRIDEVFGRNLRGLNMRDVYPQKDYDRLFARNRRVVAEPALLLSKGLVFHHLGRHGQGERISMPLADDGNTADGIIGATLYEPRRSDRVESENETEDWFAL